MAKSLVSCFFDSRCIIGLMLLLQNGYTALHIAAKKNELEIAQLLLDQKADPGARSKVRQSLHVYSSC